MNPENSLLALLEENKFSCTPLITGCCVAELVVTYIKLYPKEINPRHFF